VACHHLAVACGRGVPRSTAHRTYVQRKLTTPRAFFVYVIALTRGFTLVHTIWRCTARACIGLLIRGVTYCLSANVARIYAWLPYHKEPVESKDASVARACAAAVR